MPLHGRIALKDLKVPLNVSVYIYCDNDREADAFAAAHKAAREKAPGKKSAK
jgi:hypothetical protein